MMAGGATGGREGLALVMARGLGAAAAAAARAEGWGIEALPGERGARLESPAAREALCRELAARGLVRPGATIAWPGSRELTALTGRLAAAGIGLAWRGAAAYTRRRAVRLGDAGPAWVWIAGDGARLEARTCSIIGSRYTPPGLLEAAVKLARTLADAGYAIVSGLAPGADAAAHAGGGEGRAGTVALPARGLLAAGLGRDICGARGMTAVGLGRPDEPFSAGLAIRRNAAIAALGDGLVLVAGGLRGGSSHAVRWMVEHRRPLWCFSGGAAERQGGNRALARAGQARPLPLDETPERWLERMDDELKEVWTGWSNGSEEGAATAGTRQVELFDLNPPAPRSSAIRQSE